jgi:iron uptake system EfeUOB component EfeO/EfeM
MMPKAIARGWAATAVVAVCLAVGVFLALTALGVGDHARSARRAPVTLTPLATYSLRAPHVLSEVLDYSAQGLVRGAPSTPPPELAPTIVSAFARPIALYRAYAVAQLGAMEVQIERLQSALAENDRAAAQAAWRTAYARYLRLGAVYLAGEVAALNKAINGNAGGLEGGVSNPRFVGLHRIEYGLWTGAQPRALLGWAQQLGVAVHKLRGVLPVVSITPLEYATRAHEILEDAQRDLLSGADVPWSGEGVLGTQAGLEATEEVISTLRPVLGGVERVIPAADTEFATLRSALASIAAAHGGQLPSNGQLTQQQSELLDGTLGGALEALSEVPGVLETEAPPQIPQIPQSDFRIDPIDP